MTRHGQPIQDSSLRNRLQHGISQSARFEQWEACIAAGLDIARWDAGEYDASLMARTVAWYRLHSAVSAHVQDAAVEHQKAQARKHNARKRGRN